MIPIIYKGGIVQPVLVRIENWYTEGEEGTSPRFVVHTAANEEGAKKVIFAPGNYGVDTLDVIARYIAAVNGKKRSFDYEAVLKDLIAKRKTEG